MSRGSTLIRNLGLIGLGRVSAQAVALLLLPVLTGGLSPAEYGIVELVVTYVSLCAPLVSLQLEMAAFRFLVSTRNDPEETKATISTVGLPIVVFALFWAVAGFVLGYLIDYRLLWYFAVNLVSVILFNLVIQVARGVGRNVLFAVGNIAVALTTLAAVSSAVFFKIFSLEIYLSVLAGANAIGILIVFFSLRFYRLCDFRLFTIARLKNLLRYSLPLIPNSLSWWVISAAGRTVTAVFLGVYYVGLLAVASKFAAIVTGLSTVFSMAWMEAASVSYDDTDSPSFFSEVVNQALRFFSALTILIICAVPIMMTFLVDDDFADAYYYIPILLMGALGELLQGGANRAEQHHKGGEYVYCRRCLKSRNIVIIGPLDRPLRGRDSHAGCLLLHGYLPAVCFAARASSQVSSRRSSGGGFEPGRYLDPVLPASRFACDAAYRHPGLADSDRACRSVASSEAGRSEERVRTRPLTMSALPRAGTWAIQGLSAGERFGRRQAERRSLVIAPLLPRSHRPILYRSVRPRAALPRGRRPRSGRLRARDSSRAGSWHLRARPDRRRARAPHY